jgi:hypothetical protein
MVRHYYLRQRPWEGDMLVMLKDKNDRERGSHEIAVAARGILKPIADRLGARIAVVEMPPGPPVLQTVVAEVYGPDAETRRQVAGDMTAMFEAVEDVVDVDNYMVEPYEYWRFEVDTEKAVRRGISVDTINGTLAMAMGSYQLGDVKRGTVLEPTYIVMQIPLAIRSQVTRLGDLPVPTADGRTVPLSELGTFRKEYEDPVIYTLDLRGVEYVVGEMQGRLGAPIYGMLAVDDLVKEYTTPDGVKMPTMPWTLLDYLIKDDSTSHFEWTGEWTVTYETFRDMGGAFMAALILIYGLIVWEFKNFALAGIIMSPIPLTMLGIIPGHWILGAEFTATSMIGMIALGGIIVRQSILIVEFVKIEVAKGNEVSEAAVRGAAIRMRPIFITSLTLMAGAFAILQDPIFNGMAISLLFGAGVATVMALIVVPLGCISAKRQFYVETADDGTVSISRAFQLVEHVDEEAEAAEKAAKTPLLMRLWGVIVSAFSWVFIIIKAVFTLIGMGFKAIFGRFGRGRGGTPPPPRQPPPGGTPPPPRQPPPGGTPPPPRQPPPGGTPPPPREKPAPAGGTPPLREEPVTARSGEAAPEPVAEPVKASGEVAGSAAKPAEAAEEPAAEEIEHAAAEPDTPKPAAAKLAEVPASEPEPAKSKAGTDDADTDDEIDLETQDTVGTKRRGIRLKQDLN